MKKLLKSSIMAASMLLAVSMASCKENKEEIDTTTIESAETEVISTATDTATVVNDTNVSGTTSGEMEQVP